MQQEAKQEAKRIGIAMILGLVLGLLLHYFGKGDYVQFIAPLGDAFIALLKMVIIPLVFSSIFMAMYHLGTPESLGRMGVRAVGYYFLTTCIAVGFGIIFVNLINPGVGADLGNAGVHHLNEAMQSKVASNSSGWASLFASVKDVILGSCVRQHLVSKFNKTNFGSIYFLLAMLGVGWERSVVFPINNVAVILFSVFVALLFFKEKLSKLNWFGIILAIAAIVLIAYA